MTTNSAFPHLIVFAKNPLLGKVKTRLAKSAGDAKALSIYEQLLAENQNLCSRLDWPKTIYYADFIDTSDRWEEQLTTKRLQAQVPNLGIRLQAAIQETWQHGQPIIVTGTDCPSIEASHLTQTAELLNDYDAVIGPATDGGFYLLGLRTWHDGLFDDIQWSTDRVMNQLISNLDRLHLSYSQIESLTDIDFYKDWIEYQSI